MANIKDIHESSEFTRTLKLAGTRMNGVVFSSDDNLYKYSKDDESIVNEFESNLSTDEWESLLIGAKELRIEHMTEEFDEFAKTGFEYPALSGNWFDLFGKGIRDFGNNIDDLTFPMAYQGIGLAEITLSTKANGQTFYDAAVTAYETERIGNLVVKVASIKAISTVGIDNARIDSVYTIEY